MTAKTLAVLAGVTIVIGVGAYLVSTSRSGGVSSIASGGTTLVFPDLDAKGDSITSISITSGADEMLVHKHDKGPWTIASRDEYPADVEKVRALVVAMAQAKIAETKTSKPDFYERLGVQDATAKGSTSKLVTLKAGDAPVASLLLGNTPATRGDNPMAAPLPGVFARKAGDAQVVLLDKNIELPRDIAGWIKSEILTIDGQRIQSASYTQAAEPAVEGTQTQPPSPEKPEAKLTITKATQGAPTFDVADIPQGRNLRTPNAPSPIATLLSLVTAEDVGAFSKVDGLTPVTTATFKTFDGLIVNAKMYTKAGKNWLTLETSYAAPPKPEIPDAPKTETPAGASGLPDTQPEAKADAKPDAKADAEKKYKETADRVQKEAADLNARLHPWAFQLPDFKAKQFRTRMEDLLVELAPPDPNAPAPAVPFAPPGANLPTPQPAAPPAPQPGDSAPPEPK